MLLLAAGHAGGAAAGPGHLWRARYDVEFMTPESGRPAALIEADLRWAGGPGECPEAVEIDMAQDGFPGGYGAFVRELPSRGTQLSSCPQGPRIAGIAV